MVSHIMPILGEIVVDIENFKEVLMSRKRRGRRRHTRRLNSYSVARGGIKLT